MKVVLLAGGFGSRISEEGGTPHFGDSKVEKGLYKSGVNSVENSLSFMKWYNIAIDYIAEKHKDDTNKVIRHNMSKYSYGFLKSQRGAGLKTFNKYVSELKDMGFATSPYFYIYYLGLLVMGVQGCDKVIASIKKKWVIGPNYENDFY